MLMECKFPLLVCILLFTLLFSPFSGAFFKKFKMGPYGIQLYTWPPKASRSTMNLLSFGGLPRKYRLELQSCQNTEVMHRESKVIQDL